MVLGDIDYACNFIKILSNLIQDCWSLQKLLEMCILVPLVL